MMGRAPPSELPRRPPPPGQRYRAGRRQMTGRSRTPRP